MSAARRQAVTRPEACAAARLLDWYDVHGRNLPWRVKRGRPDPFRVWLSEVMLQQTTVATVGPYFARFLARWPTVEALAAADLDAILAAWAGLGYYARARHLHACAHAVVTRHGGRFPDTEEALRSLPGIGAYTAAAIAAIAFERPAVVVDGNVERVVARLFAVTKPISEAKAELRRLAASLLPKARFGDHAQALMDLGATVCVPRQPSCPRCPLAGDCQARRRGIAGDLPARKARGQKPTRRGAAFLLEAPDGSILLRRRPPKGLLGGMLEVPSSPWEETLNTDVLAHAPIAADWRRQDGIVRHTFTHFHLELEVYTALLERPRKVNGAYRWAPLADLDRLALPTVMKKVARHASGRAGA